jgi:hypothetical protein
VRSDFVADIAPSWRRMAGSGGMRNLKSVFGVIVALVPVLYCGGLIYYFLDASGSVEEAKTIGLGPTLLGLGVFGLLFCIPVIVKIVWMFAGPRSPASSGRRGPDASKHDGEGAFDADAVIARHMARRSADAAPGSAAALPAPGDGGPAGRASFGRKTT